MGLDRYSLSWWSLKINEADIKAAEERYLEELFPDITKEEKTAHPPFLSKFTTSPVFINETSRYGNFRFTFSLTELMEAYKKQICNDKEPVLRYMRPNCSSRRLSMLFSFTALSSMTSSVIFHCLPPTHGLLMMETKSSGKPKPFVKLTTSNWSLVKTQQRKLKASLSCCEQDPNVNLSNGQNCSSLDEAKKCIESLQDDDEKEDEKEEHKSIEVKLEVD
ncbi:hypothetical protein QQF64_000331 [Cirrhinus molitorella]|uniref:Uncharacterized protein n=1 Tax=Cirrhinus molitorella TaxID=172907 RepID=A0ABR3NXU3_9TELE